MADKQIGVAMALCYFCNEPSHIIMNTRLGPGRAAQVEKMHKKIVDMTPCQKCEDFMKRGIIVIGIDEELSDPGWENEDMPNPYRSGQWLVVTEDFIKRNVTGPLLAQVLNNRFVFVDKSRLPEVF